MNVKIVEVGPRDGFQSIKEFIPTDLKLRVIQYMVDSGIKKIQAGSFVSPKAIPQMKDSKKIFEQLNGKYNDVELYALVPNLKGAEIAVGVGIKEVTMVISVSETHNKANVNRTHNESFDELRKILQHFPELKMNIDMATVFGCPFEGEIKLSSTMVFLEKAYALGIRNFNLCDTIGAAYPTLVEKTVKEVLNSFKDCAFDIHLHDTRNMGMVNSLTAIQNGITNIQTTLGGIGGCPFAPGASGNTSTEDLVYMLEKMNISTGINFEKLLTAARYQKKAIPGNYSGHHVNINDTTCC